MKKIKIIIPVVSCLLTTALFSCANNNEQPESDYYSISIANGHKSPKVLIEGSNLIKKGEACDVSIRVEPFTYLDTIDDYPEGTTVRICQANRIGYEIALDENCYTFERDENDPCLYKLHIGKEYMTTSYVVDINSKFMKGYDGDDDIKFASDSSLDDTNANITVVNTEVDNDLTFFVTPKYFQAGYTFDGETKDAINIIGVSDDEGEVLLNDFVTRKELVPCDSPIQSLGHYQTLTKQIRIALDMTALFELDDDPQYIYGYKQRFNSIEIKSTKGVVYNNKENYEKLFYPTADETSCTLTSSGITLDNGVHYVAKFAAKTGHSFYTYESLPLTDLTIVPNVYAPTSHPYFREFEVHQDESLRKDIDVDPYYAYYGNDASILLDNLYILRDKLGNIYTPMENWLKITPSTDYSELTIDVDIVDMVKYIQFPTSTIITEFDLYSLDYYYYELYQDGSIDFIQSFNFTVRAV